jgi:hypothetical protein
MTKESVVTIKGHLYRYGYDPATKKTKFLGPVGNSPNISEDEFHKHFEGQVEIEEPEPDLRTTCPKCEQADIKVIGNLVWCETCKEHYPIRMFQMEKVVVKLGKNAPLNRRSKRRIDNELHAISQNFYERIPLDQIFEAFEKEEYVLLQEDMTPWEGLLVGREGRARFPLAGRLETGEWYPVKDHYLILSWYRHDTGRYEVNAYLS